MITTTKATPKAPIIVISGVGGSGKTTLAATFEKPIFIQCENAQTVFEDYEDGPDFFPPIIPYNKDKLKPSVPSEQIMDQMRQLLTEKHDFKTLVFDTITAMSLMFEAEIIGKDETNPQSIVEANGGYGKAYHHLAQMHAEIMIACQALRKRGITVVMLAHTGIIKMRNDPESAEYTVYGLDLPEKSRSVYENHPSAVLYLKSKSVILGAEKDRQGRQTKPGKIRNTGQRILITSEDGVTGYKGAKNQYRMPQNLEVNEFENPIIEYISFLRKPVDAEVTKHEVKKEEPASTTETNEELF